MANVEIAQTIANQLGGTRRLKSFTRAKNLAADGPSLQFRFGGQNKLNFCKITLNSLDLYDITFALRTFSRKTYKTTDKNVKVIEGVYAEDLVSIFEKTTGLFLSL